MRRTICFVTGTRAEFGLMRSTLAAIKAHPSLKLQIIATGMHLDRLHGDGLAAIRAAGFTVDRTVDWSGHSGRHPAQHAANTGHAMAQLARTFAELRPDIVLVVGDRVEAFAAASAAHLCGHLLAHVHGGDRAAGQADDSLRHAITKLAHIHFPATAQSARRLLRLGEDRWRIYRCGSPGVDGIKSAAAKWADLREKFSGLHKHRFALAVLHPADADADLEARRMRSLLRAALSSPIQHLVAIHPNNDPGSAGIRRTLDEMHGDPRLLIERDIERGLFLALMRDAAYMIGNSSSALLEAGSFHTFAIDVGPRQLGRERGRNVITSDYGEIKLQRAISQLWDGQSFRRSPAKCVYGASGAGRRIASALARVPVTNRLLRKLVTY